ncbi:MAG: DNA methyltransferase [Candidatus Bathyarchaeia archaeon]
MTKKLHIDTQRLCTCSAKQLNCMDAKEWIKAQIGVWQVYYEGRDIRDKEVHPAVMPIALAKKVIELFTHKGELAVDPFNGIGTTLLACRDLERNAVGFDINAKYCEIAEERLAQQKLGRTVQLAIVDDARNISEHLDPDSATLFFTSPPYANLLNRPRLNKSRRGEDRKNGQFLKVEQYSQDSRDLGTLTVEEYAGQLREIYARLLPILKSRGHNVINVPDMWWSDDNGGKRIPIHIYVYHAMLEAGYELRNTIIWDRTNIVNRIGIFGWPSNYITMGTTFEYLLDFWKPAA